MAGYRLDTRRYRRVNPLGPNPEEQAKLLGERNLQSQDDDSSQYRPFHERIARKEMGNPDMTPVPRRIAGRLIRLYLPGKTIIVPEVLGDETPDSDSSRFALFA